MTMSLIAQSRHGICLCKSAPVLALQKRFNTRESIHRYVEPDKFKKHMLAASEPYFRRKYALQSDTCSGAKQIEHPLPPLQRIYSDELLEEVERSDFILFLQHNYIPFQKERVYKNTIIKSGGTFYNHRNIVYKDVFSRLGMERVNHLFVSRNSLILGPYEKLPNCITALKKMPQFILLGGCMEKQLYSNNQLQIIAKTPSLDQCRANLVSILETPAIDLASYLEEYAKVMDQTK